MVNRKMLTFSLIAMLAVVTVAAVPFHLHTPVSVITSINNLRASYGLTPYLVDDLLMIAAQGQADYLASRAPEILNGHVGPGGSDADARALAAGYPYVPGLDINENWAVIPLSMSIETLIATGWSDAAHMHTMLHERGQHIGVGVSYYENTAYIIVNVAAFWGDSGLTQQPVNTLGNTSEEGYVSNYVAPVIKAEPRDDGSIVHVVQSGQSLWMLAHHYDVGIETLRQLNQMGSYDTIYIGQKILIQAAQPPTQTSPPSPTQIAPTPTVGRIMKTSTDAAFNPTPAAEDDSDNLSLIYLLFFTFFGFGLILVIIGMRTR